VAQWHRRRDLRCYTAGRVRQRPSGHSIVLTDARSEQNSHAISRGERESSGGRAQSRPVGRRMVPKAIGAGSIASPKANRLMTCSGASDECA
jgi:hypothetical protein